MADDLALVLTLLHESGTRRRMLRAEGEERSDPERRKEWPARDLAETRAEVGGAAIVEAASRAETLWP